MFRITTLPLIFLAAVLTASCAANPDLSYSVGEDPSPESSPYSASIYSGPFDALKWHSEDSVLHFDEILGTRPENVVDVHLDVYGTLYPETGYSGFDVGQANQLLMRYGGDMAWAFGEPDSVLCQLANGGDVERMCAAQPNEVETVQDDIWRAKAVQIIDQLGSVSMDDKEIIVLVHGFDVPNPLKDYELAMKVIERSDEPNRERVFVRLFWDGGGGGPTLPWKKQRWTRAQYTGPVAGFEFRRLFNNLSEELKLRGLNQPSVRIMTHSSGAYLVGATFGNPASALPKLRDGTDIYRTFAANAVAKTGRWRIPQITDLTLGLMAPATGSWTYTGFVREEPQGNKVAGYDTVGPTWFERERRGWFDFERGLQVPRTRIVATQNPSDIGVGRKGYFLNVLGAVHLGSRAASGCEVEQWSNKRGLGTSFVSVDFKPTDSDKAVKSRDKLNSHSWALYLQQEATSEFVDIFLEQPHASDFVNVCE